MLNPFQNQAQGQNNPMMTAQRPPGFMDAKTSYGGGMVNTQTQGLNPYVQFQPNRMDQMFAMLGQRRPQPQMAPEKQMQQHAPERNQYRPQSEPQDEWVDIPAQRRLSVGGPSGTVRVKRDSQAAQQTGLGVVGY